MDAFPSTAAIAPGEYKMPDADEVTEEGVAACLGENPARRIEQDDGRIGGRGAGHHVAGILFVPRAVGDDEIAVWAGEIAIGNVDRNALLTFRRQAVHQQGEIGGAAPSPDAAGIRLEGGELVVGHLPEIVEQTTNQRRLAVVNAAAGDEAEERPRHQK